MIDFNTVLNTLLDQVIKQASEPLMVRIAALEAQTKSLIESPGSADFRGFAFRDAVNDAVDNYNLDDRLDNWMNSSRSFDRAMDKSADEAIAKHEREFAHDEFLTKATAIDSDFCEAVETVIKDFVYDGEDDLEDAIKAAMNNMTLSLSVD